MIQQLEYRAGAIMKIVLELPANLEAELSAEAAELGLPVAEHALQILAGRRALTDFNIKTGADLVAYWQRHNLIGTRPDITDSQAYARALREQAQKRTRD
jgi:hypothetical protein